MTNSVSIRDFDHTYIADSFKSCCSSDHLSPNPRASAFAYGRCCRKFGIFYIARCARDCGCFEAVRHCLQAVRQICDGNGKAKRRAIAKPYPSACRHIAERLRHWTETRNHVTNDIANEVRAGIEGDAECNAFSISVVHICSRVRSSAPIIRSLQISLRPRLDGLDSSHLPRRSLSASQKAQTTFQPRAPFRLQTFPAPQVMPSSRHRVVAL